MRGSGTIFSIVSIVAAVLTTIVVMFAVTFIRIPIVAMTATIAIQFLVLCCGSSRSSSLRAASAAAAAAAAAAVALALPPPGLLPNRVDTLTGRCPGKCSTPAEV